MEVTPIDTLLAAKMLKKRVDKSLKEAEADAEAYLAEKRDTEGATGLTSPFFGEAAGEFRYSKTRPKHVVEYNMADDEAFAEWLEDNNGAAFQYAMLHATDLAKWWFDMNGELAEGVARVDYEEPPRQGPPQVYRFDDEVVFDKLGENGNALMEANRLLLGDGDE